MKKIKFSTAGESHGEMLLGILEGIPSNLEIDEQYIYSQMKRRQMGFGRSNRMKIEKDFPKSTHANQVNKKIAELLAKE